MVIPDYIEPIEKWRAWRADPDTAQLSSIIVGTPWEPLKVHEAVCMRNSVFLGVTPEGEQLVGSKIIPGTHSAPFKHCICGIYGVNDPRMLASYLNSVGSDMSYRVVGKVLLWGSLLVGPNGIRAEYASPKEILGVVVPDRPQVDVGRVTAFCETLSEKYQIPVTPNIVSEIWAY